MGSGPKFFQTRMGMRFFEVELPRLVKAVERIASVLEQRQEVVAHRQAVEEIHACLDGKEWNAETLHSVADALHRAGYKVREP